MAMFTRKPDNFSSDLIVPGRVSDDDGFIDLLNPLDTPQGIKQAVLSVGGIRQLAQRFDVLELVPLAALESADARIEELEDLLALKEDEAAALQEAHDRITGLAADGFHVQKRTGPLPQKEKK